MGPTTSGLSLLTVVQDAERDYPLIHVTEAELNASIANIQLSRTAYLPRVDGIAQFNRATRNNVFGALLPQSTLPSMSGPVIGSNNGGSVWGSATGLLISWQPFDFGLRHANVQSAIAARDRADATAKRTQIEVATAAADAYLTVLVAMRAKTAAQAAVGNWETLRVSVHALTSAELRPGADESRIEAEKAAAKTQLALADEAMETSKATLAKFLIKPETAAPEMASTHLLEQLPAVTEDGLPFQPSANPIMAEQKASVAQSAAQLHSIEKSWVPQFNLEGAAYARGTGAETNGQRLSGANGLAPNVGDYAVGVNITFPFMDFASVHARSASQASSLKAAEANEQLAGRELQEQFAQAKAVLRTSRAIAENTPVALSAAQTTLAQANARYKAGLSSIDEVAQAQRLGVQAEIDDSIARLNVWRALLHLQAVRGDLQPFLQAASR
ncbi:TolC family protein [Terriglobus saanensis]|uniref:TolC family protein n=1 Tax=Terriglobus saanensis TaxID=870903 RepID=UPI0016514ABB|nr:TolC family protein [Terriglobus saanensis]